MMSEVSPNETVGTDPLELLPAKQRESAVKLRHFLRGLRKTRPPSKNGDIFVGEIKPNGHAIVQMFAREGLYEAQTIEIDVPVLHWDYHLFVSRLADEWAEMHKALFLKTFAPDLYNGDMSPVVLTEQRTVKSMDLM
jgi:hypothetical protein